MRVEIVYNMLVHSVCQQRSQLHMYGMPYPVLLQDWSAEVNTLHTHADELKVMLCHRQGHYLSLLANGLSTLHACEVEQFEGSTQASRDAVAHDDYSSFTSVDSGRPALADDDFFLPVSLVYVDHK